jgi:hypothetical protein
MNVNPIATPLPGEHLAATFPTMRPETEAGYRQRLNFWAGRALTDDALELEQENRAAHLTWQGRLVTPGIVSGLEVALEEPSHPKAFTLVQRFVHVLPGHGISATGEDVVVPRPLRVSLDHIPVQHVRATRVSGETDALDLRIHTFDERYVPWAAVLVLCPGELRAFGKVDPEDPCELDPSRDPFADERRLDAAHFRLITLPPALRRHPELIPPAAPGEPKPMDDPRWRNRLAHVVFATEAAGAARQYLRYFKSHAAGLEWDAVLKEHSRFTWELLGVPLALLGTEFIPGASAPNNRRFFLDRASVVRRGGRARARSRPTIRLATGTRNATLHPPGAGTPELWRAQVDQFAEHLSSFGRLTPADQVKHFQFIPPAGLLPRAALSFLDTEQAKALPTDPGQAPDRAAVSTFFPPIFAVEAVPIPAEDLDFALAASAPLAPFDLATTTEDLVRILVPLAQRVFDRNVLVVELEDPFFAAEVARLIAVRQDWRQRRDFVQLTRDGLQQLIRGSESFTPLPLSLPGQPQPVERGQFEPEPIELTAIGTAEAYASPVNLLGVTEIRADFDVPHAVTPETVLFAGLRLDIEAPPALIEIIVRRGNNAFSHRWVTTPPPAEQQFDANGQALPVPLWRSFTVRADEMGLTSGNLDGFTLLIEGGRAAISAVGRIPAGSTGVESWWNAEDGPAPEFTGGDWTHVPMIVVMAPFEEFFNPTFPDKSLEERLDELPAFPASAGQPSKTVQQVGLEKLIEALSGQVDRANDYVDLAFLKTQANVHRIRQVLLGDEVADDLLISPVLSSVVKKKSARVAEEDLVAALKAAKAADARDANAPIAANASNVARFERLAAFQPQAVEAKAKAFISKGTSAFVKVASASVDVIRSAEPAIGKGFDLRTLTIAKRFDTGPVLLAYDYADVGLREVIAQIAKLDLGFDQDETVPDVTTGAAKRSVTFREIANGTVKLQDLEFVELVSDEERGDGLQADTGRLLAKGVRRADATALILRRLEYYIARRRALIERAREVLNELHRGVAEANARLAVISMPLTEARHDVSVARALRLEEQQRVDAVNERRDALIRDEVKFLAYVRPRAVNPARHQAPGWKLDAANALAPVPACLRRHDQPPDPLRSYVLLFRHAPARWFTDIAPRIRELDTREKLIELLASTKRAALEFSSEKRLLFAQHVTHVATQNALLAGFSIVEAARTLAAGVQLTKPDLHSWEQFRRQAEQHSSLGDIIDGKHGHAALARAAANLLEQVEDVATCLHAEFAAVPPAIRLTWVERYSQFDRPAPLNDLTLLPRYGSLERSARRRFQAFVDWLFQRVSKTERDAFNLINDLVRICLLLASHAPVKNLIAGHLPRPVPVRPGVLIPIRPFDPRLVKVGMEVHVWQADKIVARARVEDLHDGEVSARIERIQGTTQTLDQTMRVQFLAPAFALAGRPQP